MIDCIKPKQQQCLTETSTARENKNLPFLTDWLNYDVFKDSQALVFKLVNSKTWASVRQQTDVVLICFDLATYTNDY